MGEREKLRKNEHDDQGIGKIKKVLLRKGDRKRGREYHKEAKKKIENEIEKKKTMRTREKKINGER